MTRERNLLECTDGQLRDDGGIALNMGIEALGYHT